MRYKLIMVKDSLGKTVKTWAPNNLGAFEYEMLEKAQKVANLIGGTVKTIEADR